ncbi:Retrovirus-related Pol polyprotein from transposon RE1 [Vitis vinifera]|uniref:Retrovirus-related Pol polyprotein from transposon RE1 n=1 Tax=Vitis vinifera TaxID=29760 RepID=A0A438HTL1_VITVI|nr:Retrovirus-related Pol polyprotein from transposon RE1 [Vitis vinifera]
MIKHDKKELHEQMNMDEKPEVHHTSFGNSTSSNWIMDSGASHHVTGDLSNLSHHQPYEGPDDILLGSQNGGASHSRRSKDDVYECPWPNKGNIVGIQYQVSPPYTPEHVGSTERKHHHVVETGYSNTHNAYKCLDLSSNRVYISRHVQFIKHQFPLTSNTLPTDLDQVVSTWSSCSLALAAIQPSFCVVPTPSESFLHQGSSSTTTRPNQELLSSRSPTSSSPSIMTSAPLSVCDATPRYDLSSFSLPLSSNSSNTCSPSLSLSPPTQTQGSNPPPEPSHRIVTRSQNNIHCPKQFPGFNTNFHVTKHPFPVSLEPTTASQALQDPNWCAAMDDELAALARNRTWVLVPPPSNHNIVGCKWVFRIKRNLDGSISRYKACLVAKGFHQRPGLDVNNAFLHGNLTKDVYMAQPPRYVDQDNPTHVCHLQKALYGLKQAPRAWYTELKTFLLNFGFINSKSDTSLFIYQFGKVSFGSIKNSSTPMSSTSHLTLNDGSPPTNATQFRSLVGGLQYLQLTRPAIAFVVNKLAQFMHAPTQTHWTAAKRLLHYLKHTIHFGLTFQRPQPLHLQAYSDVTPPLIFELIPMPIRLATKILTSLPLLLFFFLVAIQSLGVQKNRRR